MNLKLLLPKRLFNQFSRFRPSTISSISYTLCNPSSTITSPSASLLLLNSIHNPAISISKCCFHSTPEAKPTTSVDIGILSPQIISNNQADDEDDGDDTAMNDFLSRFVYTMRGQLNEAYPDCDKQTIDGMLMIIVEKVVEEMEKGSLEHMLSKVSGTPSQDFSEDLWKTVWEVSNQVCKDMEKEKKKERIKTFMQCEEVKEMTRFASEVGIRGDMLRELRFKWALESMEESDFYESLERLREEETVEEDEGEKRKQTKAVGLPKRHGKLKYKIYGLDLSDSKWQEVADRVHEAEEMVWPEEPKPITGKCKLVMEKIVGLKEGADLFPLLREWVELVQPSRAHWIDLLEKLKQQNITSFYQVAEHLLGEPSFQASIHDYSKLIGLYAQENRMEDVERVLKKMNENNVEPDVLTLIVLVHTYGKAGNLNLARKAFDCLRAAGFKPDTKIYGSMIMAYVNAGRPVDGESLMREMETRDIKPSKEIYMALLRSFAQRGDVKGAQRIDSTMQFAGFQPSLESCSSLVEAHGRAGDADLARNSFDYMMKVGLKPDDNATANMIAAYEKKNLLNKALDLLLQLEKDGFEPGVATYTILVDWLGRLQLVDEAEQILRKIAACGEPPSLKLQVVLCEMYSRAGIEKKALQASRVLEAKKEELGQEEFERVVTALLAGGFANEARRVREVMEAQGFEASESLKVSLMASRTFHGGSGGGKKFGMR